MLANLNDVLKKAQAEHYAVGLFNTTDTDMLEAGIVDPTKVTRSALQNAASVASTFLTTEAAVVDIPQKETPMPGAPGMGGMDGMY